MVSPTSRQEQLAEQASFIFKGTVKELNAATMSNVPITNRTAIVHVDEIMPEPPKLLSSYQGKDITVQLNKGERLKEGQQAIFYTNAWLFGDSVAVQSTGHTEFAESATAAAKAVSSLPSSKDRKLHEHLRDADVVVKGKVVSVGLPKQKAMSSSKAKVVKETGTTRYSEHSPKWNEAIVDVESVEKGQKLQKQITVRFPRTEDVAWRRALKLDPGQEGIFILHKTATAASAKKQAAGAAKKRGVQSYEVLHDGDFLPASKASKVRNLIQSSASSKSSKRAR
jgi:hypothetical protein